MPRSVSVGVVALALAVAGETLAQPVQLSDMQFKAQTGGLPAITETFEGFAVGTYASPLVLVNGTYTAASPAVEQGGWCLLSHCLGERASMTKARVFASFQPATTHWSANVLYASVNQVLRVTVIGNGGTLVVDLPPNPSFSPGCYEPAPVPCGTGYFFGFADGKGLLSVTFEQPGGVVNYSFDNVVTASTAQAPTAPSATGIPALERSALITLSLMLAVATAFAVEPHRKNGDRPR